MRALTGGRDWNESNFNGAVQALRQPGSSFKPFVYAAALDNGFKPTDIVVDETGGGQHANVVERDNVAPVS